MHIQWFGFPCPGKSLGVRRGAGGVCCWHLMGRGQRDDIEYLTVDTLGSPHNRKLSSPGGQSCHSGDAVIRQNST